MRQNDGIENNWKFIKEKGEEWGKKKEAGPNLKKQKAKNLDWRIKLKNKTKTYKKTKNKNNKSKE